MADVDVKDDPKEDQGLLPTSQNSVHIISSSSSKDSEDDANNKMESSDVVVPAAAGGQLKKRRHHIPTKKQITTKKVKQYMAKKARSCCSLQSLVRKIPAINWARNYNLDCLTGDLIAGLTCALTVIPQGIGYAPLAGLPLQYGLYASIVPGFAYAIFGTIKEATVGPTAVNALMSYNYAGTSVTAALTLSFFTGLIEIAAGILNLGVLINYISAPVISAFTSAVSIQVATSQVKGLLGLRVAGRGFLNTWIAVFKNFSAIRPCDAALGFSCIGILLFLRKLKDFRWCEGTDPETQRARVLRKVKWIISITRNSMVVLVCSVIAYAITEVYGYKDVLIITGSVEEGLPSWQLPWQFNVNASNSSSDTNPLDMVEDFGIGLLMLPLVSILQQLAIAKFYTPPSGRMDASQEIVALGVCQFVGSFIGSMPVTASFGRSAINSSSGVRTPFGGIVTGLIILAACAFLTPHFAYIPTSALSAVIICAMIFTIEVEILLPMWRSKKLDILPYSLTFLIGLFVSPEMGMIIGTASHLCILLYTSGSPKITITKGHVDNVAYLLVRPDRALFYPSVETIRTKLTTASKISSKLDAESGPGTEDEDLPIILDLSNVCEMDYTAAKGIRALSKVLKRSGQNVYFCAVNENIESVLQGADPALFVSYCTVEEAEQRLRGS